MTSRDHRRLYDLPNVNEDLRDGVVDNPSTQQFVEMMDRTETELPDDVILTRIVGLDTFGFTPETATGTDSDTDPGIRGLSGRLVADRGYSPMTVGNVDEVVAVPPGSVRMVVAAKKGTKVNVPGASASDHTIFLTRDQPLRITKIKPDGAGGWHMYVTTDESSVPGETPEPMGGPKGLRPPPTQEREAAIRDLGRIQATREKRPDEQKEQAEIEAQRARAAEAAGQPQVPSPAQEAERQRVETLPQQPAPGEPPPRTEPPVGRVGEPGAPEAGGVQPQAPAPTVPEAPAAPRRSVDIRMAVRDAGIPSPSRGKQLQEWNEAYLGLKSGRLEPDEAARQLDANIRHNQAVLADARSRETGIDVDDLSENIKAQEALRDLIREQYDLPGPTPAPVKKAAPEKRTAAGLPKVERPEKVKTKLSQREQEAEARNRAAAEAEVPPAPVPAKKAPAKKAAKKAAPSQAQIEAEEERFRRELAEESAAEFETEEGLKRAKAKALPPVKKVAKKAPAKKAAPAELTPEQRREFTDLSEQEQRSYRARRRAGRSHDEALQSARDAVAARNVKQAEEAQAPGDDLDKMTKQELLDEAARREVTVPKSWTKDKIKAFLREEGFRRPEKKTPEQRKAQRKTDQELDQELKIGELFEGEKPTVKQLRDYARIRGMEPPDATIKQGYGKPLSKMTRPELIGLILSSLEGERRFTGDRVGAGGLPNASQVRQQIISTPENQRGDLLDGILAPLTQPQRRRLAAELGVKGQGRQTEQGPVLDAIREHFRTAVPEGAPETPTPVKKAAKAAVPGAAPDTANLKIGQGVSITRIRPGDVVWVEPAGQVVDGKPVFTRTKRKGPSFPLTVTQNERRSGNDYVLHGTLPDGREVRTAGYFGQNTFYRVEGLPEGGVPAPAKKAVKKAAPEAPEADATVRARERQANIDRAKAYGSLGSEFDELIDAEVSDRTLRARVTARMKQAGLPEEDLAAIRKALEPGGRSRFEAQSVLREILRRNGVEITHPAGAVVPLDRTNMVDITGSGVPGDVSTVHVVRPGYRMTLPDGEVVQERTVVEAATPEEIRAFEQGRRLVPEGSVSGTRADVPVETKPRKRELRQAWIAADIQPPPGPVRTQTEEIRDKLFNGDLTPEEAIRMMESEIAFNKEDLAELDAHLREADLGDKEKAEFQDRAVKLTQGIEEQEKAATFLRAYFKDEAPVVSLQEAKETDPVSYEFLKDATPDDMREAAKEAGLDAPSGDTPDEMFTDLLKQIAKKELDRRAAKKAAKKVPAKAIKKAAPPAVPREKEKVDARLLAEGLHIKGTLVSDVQRALDGGSIGGTGKNPTPRQIAEQVDGFARGIRDSAAIQHGAWGIGGPGIQRTPEEEAQRQRDFDLGMARAQALEQFAERIRGVRRRSTPAKKAAPEPPKEIRTRDQQIDDLQKRIVDNALKELTEAKTRDKGDDALEGLTMADLRRIADGAGIKSPRSKRALRDAILDHFKGAPEALTAPPTPETPTPVPTPRVRSLSARAREAGIDSPGQLFSDVDSAVGDADRRLQGGESATTVARSLRERAARVAKADINEEGRRFRVAYDKDTLLSIRKASAEYLRRLATFIQQEAKESRPAKKAPAKKAAPARDLGAELQMLARGGTPEERPGMRPDASRTGTSPVGGTKPEGTPFRPGLKRDVTDSQGRIILRDRPRNDEPLHLPNRGNDQGLVHLNSELGELWAALYTDDREPNSFVNEIALIGEQVGAGQLPLVQALERLARMKERATDKAVEARIQQAIDAMDAPAVTVPDLPDTVPASIKEALRKLAEIPTARSTKVRGIGRGEPSVFDRKLDIIRRIDAGDEERRLDMMLRERDLHESVDGAVVMWRLFEGTDIMRDLARWRREAYRRAHPTLSMAWSRGNGFSVNWTRGGDDRVQLPQRDQRSDQHRPEHATV
jgi:hypothetical protein